MKDYERYERNEKNTTGVVAGAQNEDTCDIVYNQKL